MRTALLVIAAAALVAAQSESPHATTPERDRQVKDALPDLVQAADRFAQSAQGFYCHETLRQRVIRAAPVRRGPLQYDQRLIVSYYAFTTLAGSSAIREVRQVIAVDKERDAKDPEGRRLLHDALAARNDEIKGQLMKQFADLGLNGVATDLGQLVLIFGRSGIDNYGFEFDREETSGYNRTLVVRYVQTHGREGVHISEHGKQKKDTLRGWLWLRLPDYLPLRITMITTRRNGKHEVRDEAEVDYTDSQKALLPTEVLHRRYEDDTLVAEDDFQYSNWQPIVR